MRSLYRSLLRLYPAEYRDEYGEEMVDVFLEAHKDISRECRLTQVMFGIREFRGLLRGALQEHLRIMKGFHRGTMFSPMFLPRRLSMRSEFRFPKATVTLMVLILAGVLMAIDKARSIQQSIPPSHPAVGPIQAAEPLTLLPALLIVLASAFVAGVIGWGILYSLRGSGAQRLSEINTAGNHSPSGK